MRTVEKRDYIHSHLHQFNKDFIDEVYQKMSSVIEDSNSIAGYDSLGNPIKKHQMIADIKEAEEQIGRGEYITLEELDKESETW